MQKVTVDTIVDAPIERVWECFTKPEHIVGWNNASADWECPKAENNVRVGGRFTSTMSAKDGSVSFDFTGTYTRVEEGRVLEYTIDGGRQVSVVFEVGEEKVRVVETFDTEDENPVEMQRAGWQAILDNFKRYVESHS